MLLYLTRFARDPSLALRMTQKQDEEMIFGNEIEADLASRHSERKLL
jgi:hypothetical protein